MRTIHTEIGIGAPAAKVWDILVAIDKWPEWNPFARPSGRLQVGERLEVEIRPPGQARPSRWPFALTTITPAASGPGAVSMPSSSHSA